MLQRTTESFQLDTDASSHERILALQKPIDSLIALSERIESPEVAIEAERIIQHMQEVADRPSHFQQLEELARLTEVEPELHPIITDTAEFLMDELEQNDNVQNILNISIVWSSIHAWDTLRENDSVTNLCITTINNFRGEGQVNLSRAFRLARESGESFDDSLEATILASYKSDKEEVPFDAALLAVLAEKQAA